MANFHVNVPDNFNFITMWLTPGPRKSPTNRLCYGPTTGEKIQFTFADIKRESDRTASFFQSLGIGRGDMVML